MKLFELEDVNNLCWRSINISYFSFYNALTTIKHYFTLYSINLEEIKQSVAIKKAKLDKLQPINSVIQKSLLEWINLELTYTC